MHSSLLIIALAASASFISVSARNPVDKRHGSLVDIDALAVAPILNDLEVVDLKKRSVVDVDAVAIAPILNNLEIVDLKKRDGLSHQHKRLEKIARGLDGIEVSVGIDVSVKVKTLIDSTLEHLEPVFDTIEDTIAKADTLAAEELTEILRTSFGVIHKATGGLSRQLKQTGGGFLKRTRAAAAAAGQGQGHVEERALTDAEVAQVLSILLNRVAGVIKLAEGLVGKVPILGDVLDPIFRQINGDIALILSSVKYLLVGVIGLVRDLLTGVIGTVVCLPIIDSLLGGLL